MRVPKTECNSVTGSGVLRPGSACSACGMTASFSCIHILRRRVSLRRGPRRGFYRDDWQRIRIEFLLCGLRSFALFVALAQLVAIQLEVPLPAGYFIGLFFRGKAFGSDAGNFAVGPSLIPMGLVVAFHQD